MDPQVKCSSNDKIKLVPATSIPIQTGPGDDSLMVISEGDIEWYHRYLYLGGSTLVPGAVIKDVLPLLEDQNEVEIGCLKHIKSL